LKKFEFAGLLTGQIEPGTLGDALASVASEDTLLVASSDLSHYHPYEQARALDALANESVPALDLRAAQGVEACGKTGVLALMHCAKKLGWKGEFLDYRNSGDTSGDKAAVVGYGCYAFFD
jgi:AmmeMemoRadiSam system protein B